MKMSNLKLDKDGFQIVSNKNKRNSKRKPTKILLRDEEYKAITTDVNFDISLKSIHAAVEDLKTSEYWKQISKSVSNLIQTRGLAEIVCFGLGHIGECPISRHQLAFLLCLKDLYNPLVVYVHDPIFYPSECKVLADLDLQLIKENKEGNYSISEDHTTLAYLPHCPKQLTNNFLWSNWGKKLQNCVLICNSFSSLIENQPSRLLSETVPYICKIFPYTQETEVENCFKYTDIFNDTSIHCFPSEKIEKLDSEFWLRCEKPKYDNSEEFITSLMIEKLNI